MMGWDDSRKNGSLYTPSLRLQNQLVNPEILKVNLSKSNQRETRLSPLVQETTTKNS